MVSGMAAGPDANQQSEDTTLGEAIAAGQRVLGRYVLAGELGRGGMGVVWRAQDEILGESVALKFLPDYVTHDAVALEELKEETRRARRLTHPNIVRVHDFIQQDGVAAVSMEFIDGATLTQRRLNLPGRLFSVTALAPLTGQLCAALEYAHRTAKTAHRDLKPANVLVTHEGVAKMADFGIARSLSETRTRLTMPGNKGASGTLAYMSPQQMRGDRPQATDDIYALGATLYELFAGKPPFFRGDLVSLMLQIRDRPPPPIATMRTELEMVGEPVPAAWEEVIIACLAKEPQARPQSAAEVAARLGLGGGTARRLTMGRGRAGVFRQTWLKRVLLAGATAALLVLGIVFWPAADSDERTPPMRPPMTQAPVAPSPPPAAQREQEMTPIPAVTRPEPEVVREFHVSVSPAEAAARLWLGPISDFALKGGRATLLNVPDGTHELVVQAAGYQPFTTQVSVKDGRGQAEVRLVAVRGSLEVTARPGTRVAALDSAGAKVALGVVGSDGVLPVNEVLPVGSYTLRLEHDDCEPLEENRVELAVGRVTRRTPVQTPVPADLQVKSTPTGAEISVNGKVAGRTPAALSKQISEQNLRVELALAGYRRVAKDVRLVPREQRELDFGALDPERGSVVLKVADASFPIAEAELKIDGKIVVAKPVGEAWTIEDVRAGARELEVVHRDFAPWKHGVEVRDRQGASVTMAPVAKPAQVAIDVGGPREFTVWLGGERAEVVEGRVAVPSRKAVVMEVRAAGYRPVVGTVTLLANAQKTMPIVLEPQPQPRAGSPHENTLRMKFVPVAGLGVLFSIWETREQDFELYLFATKQKTLLPAGGKVSNKPSVGMTWEQANGFCLWLTEVERRENNLGPNQRYRLPTDAEWSLVVGLGREAGNSPAAKNVKILNVYPWGKQWPPPARAGNYAGEEVGLIALQISGFKDGFEEIAPVGSFTPNPLGIFDLGGNVWEWCEDEYQPGSGRRVARGASFREHDRDTLLSSARGSNPQTEGSANLGFRCVLELGAAEK